MKLRREKSERTIQRAIDTVLEDSYWPPDLQTGEPYSRVHDDCDGDQSQTVCIMLTPDGDAWLQTGFNKSLRFRTEFGGGMSLRVRNAMLILAEAIRRDNQERPQR